MAFYLYDPSLAATIVFTIVFGISTGWHAFQIWHMRSWYFIPFLVGGLFEVIGYMVRAISVEQGPDYEKGAYIIQYVLILLAPALYAASIYMVLKRIIRLVEAEHYALIRPKWLTKFFVAGDVVSFIVQGVGGSVISSADTIDKMDLGRTVLIVGLFVQLVVFGLFIIVTALFHYRIHVSPTPESQRVQVPWLRFIFVLYGASALVMVRSIFRVAEYVQGREGELQSNETYFYLLDTLLMFLLSALFNFYHPGSIISGENKDKMFPLESRRNSTHETIELV